MLFNKSTVLGLLGSNTNKYMLYPTERKNNALTALKLLCESPALEPHMLELLSAKDSQGQTPFMLGVSYRAYPAASIILDTIQMVAGKQAEVEGNSNEINEHLRKRLIYSSIVSRVFIINFYFAVKNSMNSMIYPRGSNPDHNPLHVLCCNDTCSFTWTGAEHINQDIFECRTCGLTESLCCCTECARVCHKVSIISSKYCRIKFFFNWKI